MGSTASISNEEVNSTVVNEAKTFFSNTAMLKEFWKEIAGPRESASLMDVLELLSSTDYGNVVLYASPFLGPFATSRFCLRQAFYTSTDRFGEADLSNMTISEDELPIFLKHLFFFHRLYALFDQTFEYNAILTKQRYGETLEYLNERDLRPDELEEKFAALVEQNGGDVTYSSFVKRIANVVFPDSYTFPEDVCDALMTKTSEEVKDRDRILRQDSSCSISHDLDALELIVSWYSVRDGCDEWMKGIESLGTNTLRSLFNQLKCVRCCFCQSLDDSNLFLTFLWIEPHGVMLYDDFLREQMAEGGLYQSAMEDGAIISAPVEVRMTCTKDDWKQNVEPSHVLSLIHFTIKDLSATVQSRDDGALPVCIQESIGKCVSSTTTDIDGMLVSHYLRQRWQEGGPRHASNVENNLVANNVELFCVHNIQGEVIASFANGLWVESTT